MIEAVTIFVKLSDLALRKLHPETKQATILHGAIFFMRFAIIYANIMFAQDLKVILIEIKGFIKQLLPL